MKVKILLSAFIFFTAVLAAQPKPKQARWVMDNLKAMTDGNTSFYNVYSDYEFPYYIPSQEDITEKLIRIVDFLEKSTTKDIFDGKNDQIITDYKKLSPDFKLGNTDFKPYTYEWGVTYSGMLKAFQATKNEKFKNYTLSRFQLLTDVIPAVENLMKKDDKYRSPFHAILKPQNLDQSGAMCAAMIQWTRNTKLDFSLQKFIDNYIDFIVNKEYRLSDGTFARKGPYDSTLWLDDMYMGIPALAQMYALTKDEKYLDDAVKQVLQFSDRMFVESTNLYMHSYVTTMYVHPKMYWGRANGWATLAMVDLLDVMPINHPKYKDVLAQFQNHCFGLLDCQAKNGMWHQLLNRNDSYLESSATAMFVYGFAKGVNSGWLDNKAFGPAALLGWNGLSEQINNMGQIENVCVGTGVAYEPAYYYYRHVHVYTAHGYGPVLMAGAETINMIKKFKINEGNSILFHDEK